MSFIGDFRDSDWVCNYSGTFHLSLEFPYFCLVTEKICVWLLRKSKGKCLRRVRLRVRLRAKFFGLEI